MFFAAFMSRSCTVPQCRQDHSLIRKLVLPFGLLSQYRNSTNKLRRNTFCLLYWTILLRSRIYIEALFLMFNISLSYQIVNAYMRYNLINCVKYLVQFKPYILAINDKVCSYTYVLGDKYFFLSCRSFSTPIIVVPMYPFMLKYLPVLYHYVTIKYRKC